MNNKALGKAIGPWQFLRQPLRGAVKNGCSYYKVVANCPVSLKTSMEEFIFCKFAGFQPAGL